MTRDFRFKSFRIQDDDELKIVFKENNADIGSLVDDYRNLIRFANFYLEDSQLSKAGIDRCMQSVLSRIREWDEWQFYCRTVELYAKLREQEPNQYKRLSTVFFNFATAFDKMDEESKDRFRKKSAMKIDNSEKR